MANKTKQNQKTPTARKETDKTALGDHHNRCGELGDLAHEKTAKHIISYVKPTTQTTKPRGKFAQLESILTNQTYILTAVAKNFVLVN